MSLNPHVLARMLFTPCLSVSTDGLCTRCAPYLHALPCQPSHAQAYKAAFARRATLKVASKGITSLHTADKEQPNPVEGTYATLPYSKSVWPRTMGTNQVFLGQAE